MGDVADAVAALGKAVASTDKEKARNRVIDILASTTSGRAAQQLCEALVQSSPSRNAVVTDLKSVAAICVDHPRKAELLAFALLQQLVTDSASTENAVETYADALLQVSLANPFVVSGFLAALEHLDFQAHLDTVLQVLRRALVGALVSSSGISCSLKLSIVHALVRVAFGSEDPDLRTLSSVASPLVQATSLFPESSDPEAASTFATLVSSTVDVLNALPVLSSAQASWPRVVAAAILRRVAYAFDHSLTGVLSLLQALLDLVKTHPDALLSSSVLVGVCARLLVHPESGSLEQSLVLRVLHAVFLRDQQAPRAFRPRGVYVEILLVPLVSTVSTHSLLAAPLLQWIMDVTTSTEYVPVDLVDLSLPPSAPDVDTVHVWTFLELLARPTDCVEWLHSMFPADAAKATPIADPMWLAVQLGALLVDRRGSLRVAALDALDRQVQHHRHAWGTQAAATVRLLVSTLVHLTSYRRATSSSLADDDACWLSHALQTLVRVAATTSETLKVALRLVQRLRSQPSLRAQVLHLVFLMWTHDTRVYPQLESALLETEEASENDDDDDTELAVVRMATLLGLCERDPERGVEWVAAVQRGLEDPQAPVAAMAVRAVTALCAAEWLDLDTTVKILATKKKKGRLAAVDDVRVQRELCRLYALAGPETSAKCTARAVDELWTLVEAEDASVRCEAVKALVGIPLASVGLQVAERDDDEEDDDEEEDDEEDEEASVRERVEHLWRLLDTERDAAVRSELEALLARVVEAEGQQLHGSVSGRSVDVEWALESRVSSAATKELRRALPTRARVLAALDETTMDSWRRLLWAYVPSEDAAALKRKDKRLRVVQSHVDDMASTLDRVLSAIASAGSAATGWWTAADDSAHNLLDALLWKNAWQSFMTKFVDRLVELSELKTPSTAAASANAVHTIVDSLQQRAASEPVAFVALAALSHQLTRRSVDDHGAATAIRRALRHSVDERRVFKAGALDDRVRRCLLMASLLLSPPASASIEADAALARAVVDDETERSLDRAVAMLCLGQYGAAMSRDLSSELFSLKSVAEGVWNGLLASTSLRSQPQTELFPLEKVDLDVRSPAIEFVSTSKRSVNAEPRTTLLWAACMALASIATHLPQRQRLDWLDNLRVALTKAQSLLEDRDAALVLAVARAPVLLSSAQFNIVSSDEVSEFVAELTQSLNTLASSSTSSARNVASLVLPAMLCRMARLRGGYAVDLTAVVEPVVQQLSNVDVAFALAAAVNWFHCDVGAFTGCADDRDDDVESDVTARIGVAWDVATVQRMLESLPETSTAAAALADRSESLVVVQKNKTFDVELPVLLPNTSLQFKILAFLRDSAQSRSTDRRGVATMTLSLLRCLCRVPHVIPSLDLATLLARLARRFGSDAGRNSKNDSVLGAALSLASMHGSGVEYLRRHAFTRAQLLNVAPHVLIQAIEALVDSADPSNSLTRRGRGKVVSLTLVTEFLGRQFSALACRWTKSSRGDLVDAWGSWIDGLAKLLHASAADNTSPDEATIEALAPLVLDLVLPGLPFSPLDAEARAVRLLLQRMGANVLAPIALSSPGHGERIVTWVLSTPEAESSSWWYRGILLAAFVDRLGLDGERLRATPRLIFQWLLQQDFNAWSSASSGASDDLVLDLATVIAYSPTTKDPVGGHETWVLEALDCIHRDMTSQTTVLDSSRLLKWRAFFVLVATVVVLHHAQYHERELLKHGCLLESAALRTMKASTVRLHRGDTPAAMWDRLVAIRGHVAAFASGHAQSTLDPLLSVIEALMSQIHVASDDRLPPPQKKTMLAAVISHA